MLLIQGRGLNSSFDTHSELSGRDRDIIGQLQHKISRKGVDRAEGLARPLSLPPVLSTSCLSVSPFSLNFSKEWH